MIATITRDKGTTMIKQTVCGLLLGAAITGQAGAAES